jgi:outer membrane lipoprotein-sorting protein
LRDGYNGLIAALIGCILSAFLPGPGLGAQEGRGLALLEEAGERYRAVQSFCAKFDQALYVPLLRETTPSAGTLCQKKPNLFAMRFTDPMGDILLADGESFWVYYPSTDPKQVLQFSMETQPGGVDFHRDFLDSPGEKYEILYEGEEILGGRSTHLIRLTPLQASGFIEASIWLDAERSLILQARIGMEDGSVRTVTLSGIQLNPPEDPGRFQFVTPDDARVIRRH